MGHDYEPPGYTLYAEPLLANEESGAHSAAEVLPTYPPPGEPSVLDRLCVWLWSAYGEGCDDWQQEAVRNWRRWARASPHIGQSLSSHLWSPHGKLQIPVLERSQPTDKCLPLVP